MSYGVINSAIRTLFAWLDSVIYGLAAGTYNLIKTIAGISIFGPAEISKFSTKIYQFMGLFMLFKVAFSLLTYIVNPDSMRDENKGAGAIAKNIIIVLILIIMAPFAFDKLSEAQNIILEEGIIERFVFEKGTSGGKIENKFQMSPLCGDKVGAAASDGDFVALSVFSGFYQVDTLGEELKPENVTFKNEDGCVNHYRTEYNNDSEEALSDAVCQGYCPAHQNLTVSTYATHAIATEQANGTYVVSYKFLWSTISGVVLLLMFLNIALEIAKRAVKLGFLQLIAPIPIISYVDPKSGKDGMFKKWSKELLSTWASLFIRLGAVYMAIYIISLIVNNPNTQDTLVRIFIIFGCLLFAKELPKLIEQLVPGLNMSGKFTLNPIKNFRENSIGSKYVSAAGAWAVGTAGGIVANSVNAYKNRTKMTRGQIARSIIAGGAAGGFYSMQNGYRNDRIFSSALSGTNGGVRRSGENRNTRAQFAEEGKTWGPTDKLKDWFTDVTATRTETGTTSFIKNEINDSLRRIEDYMRDEAIASRALNDIMASDNGTRFSIFNELITQTSPSKYTKDHGIEYFYQYNAGDYSNYYNNKMASISNESEYQNLSSKLQQLSQQLQTDKAYYDQAVISGAADNVQHSYEARYRETEVKQREAQAEFDRYMKSKMATESEFNSIMSARTTRDTANSNQNKEKFRKESLEKRQKSMKPTSNK